MLLTLTPSCKGSLRHYGCQFPVFNTNQDAPCNKFIPVPWVHGIDKCYPFLRENGIIPRIYRTGNSRTFTQDLYNNKFGDDVCTGNSRLEMSHRGGSLLSVILSISAQTNMSDAAAASTARKPGWAVGDAIYAPVRWKK